MNNEYFLVSFFLVLLLFLYSSILWFYFSSWFPIVNLDLFLAQAYDLIEEDDKNSSITILIWTL